MCIIFPLPLDKEWKIQNMSSPAKMIKTTKLKAGKQNAETENNNNNNNLDQ